MPAPSKKPFQDYYLLFGLQQSATQSEIKTAYRELALKFHPDKNPSPEAHQQFLMLNEAYKVLNNIDQRNKYDLRYKQYYDPHKKSAGITERIEINRAKRASRYGRSMYSQRMRYRGSSSGPSTRTKTREQRNTYSQQNSTYNWDEKEIDQEELTYKKYASIVQVLVLIIFLFSSYTIADYFFRVLSEKIKVVETVASDTGDTKVFARKYYYQSIMFYIKPNDSHYFSPNTEVQLERAYFSGKLYQIRVHKEGRILLLNPTKDFFDHRFILLILVVLSSFICLVYRKSASQTLILGAVAFLCSIIWSLAI